MIGRQQLHGQFRMDGSRRPFRQRDHVEIIIQADKAFRLILKPSPKRVLPQDGFQRIWYQQLDFTFEHIHILKSKFFKPAYMIRMDMRDEHRIDLIERNSKFVQRPWSGDSAVDQ
ncbi:Uncharacterised protein [Mycobacterium tuberculosis]|nr:Uncharacterised protein [Mycobacterium tuberculosis]